MSTFEKFASQDIGHFVAHTRRKGGLLFFHHIPKTAGTSLVQELREVMPPYANIFYQAQPGGPTRDIGLTLAVEAFLNEYPSRQYRSASGHLRLPHLRIIQEVLPHTRVFTFLRDPVERVISEYRYTRTPKHPNYTEIREKYPNIEKYVADPVNHNRMWNFLAPRGLEADENGIWAVFRRHLFIGTIETLPRDFGFLTALFGCPKESANRLNLTRPSEQNVVEKSPALIAEIQRVNSKDLALYSAVRQMLDKRSAEMNSFIVQRRRLYSGHSEHSEWLPV